MTDYKVKVRKYTWWWLLLLLPLLLLIPFTKTVYIQTIDTESSNPTNNVAVYFHYEKQSIRISENPVFQFERTTDSNGVVAFYHLEYKLHSWLFKHFSKTLIYANTGCFASDTLALDFHEFTNGDTVKLNLHPLFIPLDFKVVDNDDNEPLPDSKVEIIAEFNGKYYLDSAVSQADGRVVFDNIPQCGIIKSVKGSLHGYYSDSIIDKSVQNLAGDINQKRILKLKPVTAKLVFYVTDCRNQEPIPNAKVTIDITGKKTITKKTNVNGVGKGEFSDAHIITDISLTAEKTYYKKGFLKGKYKVEEFIKLPKEDRTICLEPLEHNITFKNIDKQTGKALGGVKNTINIISKDGSETTTQVLLSNKNGVFIIAGIFIDDKISILAQYPPNYEDNDTKIRDAKGISLLKSSLASRTIPLTVKEVELIFRTVDFSTKSLIPNVKLKITVDGIQIPTPSNSGTGEFKIKLPSLSVISIIADGRGVNYNLNDTKIKNAPATILVHSSQKKRNIPLKRPEYVVDVVFVIDLSGSMADKMEILNKNIPKFYSLLKTKMSSVKKLPEIVRLRLIGFHNGECEYTKFYYVPDELADFKRQLADFKIDGGTENGLDALVMAYNSKWQSVGTKKRRIILLFTDDKSEPLGTYIGNTAIINHEQLKNKWDKLQPNTHLVMFLNKESSAGYNQIKPWTNTSDFDISEYDFEKIIEEIAKRL